MCESFLAKSLYYNYFALEKWCRQCTLCTFWKLHTIILSTNKAVYFMYTYNFVDDSNDLKILTWLQFWQILILANTKSGKLC